jgi:PAS domain S-box-containing protein
MSDANDSVPSPVDRAHEEISAHLRDVLENSRTTLYEQDAQLRVTKIFNEQADFDIVGKTDHDFLPAEEAERIVALKRRVLEEGITVRDEIVATLPGIGRRVWDCVFRPILGDDGKPTGIAGISTDITERREAIDRLRIREAEYRELMDNADDCIAILDERETLYRNPSFERLIGYTTDETAGRSPFDLVSDEDHGRATDVLSRVMKGERVPPLELDFVSRDGTRFTMEANGTRIVYGGRHAALAILRDVTERRQAEAELRASKELSERLIETAGAIILTLDRQANVTLFNAFAEQLTGYGKDEVVGRNWFELFIPERDRGQIPQVFEQVLRRTPESSQHENHIVTKCGDELLVSWKNTVLHDEHGEPEGVLSIGIDITESKRTEQALIESESRFRQMADSIREVFYLIDLRSHSCIYVSPAFENIWGRRIADVYADLNTVADGVHPEDRERFEATSAAAIAGHNKAWTYRVIHTDGTVRWVSDRCYPVRDEQGTVTRMVGMCEDITERKRIEEELERANKLEAVGLLAGGIAHDFNNILAIAMGNISLAMLDLDPDSEIHQRLQLAEEATVRAQALTQQLLTFARGGAPVKQATIIRDIIVDSTEFALRGQNVKAEFSIADDLRDAEIDVGQVWQVVHNLVINANQAMPEGGVVRVDGANVTVREGDSLPLKPGDYVCITISDDGMGVAEDHLQRIFDPFFTTKPHGTGLGLAIAYSIITQHEGHITAESELGGGARFHIYLPALKERVVPPEPVRDEPISGAGRVLIMDDEEMVREVTGRMLERMGYEVDYASDGAEAIRKYRDARYSPVAFDAVIIDLTVPGGMGGKRCMQILRGMDPDIRAIVSSGYSNDPVLAEFRRHGFRGCISKPYKTADLARVLREALAGRRPAS